jgi:serine/threonine protein phosphatase 1
MRTLVIGDIHGGLRALHQIMERAKVTEDSLIFLDYVDGWSQSPQVLDYLIELNKHKQLRLYPGK